MDYYKVSDLNISVIKSEWIVEETESKITVSFPPDGDKVKFRKSSLFTDIESAKRLLISNAKSRLKYLRGLVSRLDKLDAQCFWIEGMENESFLDYLEEQKLKMFSFIDN